MKTIYRILVNGKTFAEVESQDAAELIIQAAERLGVEYAFIEEVYIKC